MTEDSVIWFHKERGQQIIEKNNVLLAGMNVEGRKKRGRYGDKSETMVRQSNEIGKLTRKGERMTTKAGGGETGKDERQT
jgi:hypothetical protein